MGLTAAQVETLMQRVEFFNGLSHEEVNSIFKRGMTMRVPKGEVVFYKGTAGGQMYVVLGGVLGVVDNEKVIARLKTGDMFGEMGLVTHEPRSATVQALEDSQVFVLSQTFFERLLTKRVAIRLLLNIIKTLSHRLKDTNARLIG